MTGSTEGDPPVEFSSPVCGMKDADDVYMGYAGKDELVAFLNSLLEAERAGAKVTLESAREAGSGPIAELMQAIQHDEAHWAGMLARQLKVLGATPSSATGSTGVPSRAWHRVSNWLSADR